MLREYSRLLNRQHKNNMQLGRGRNHTHASASRGFQLKITASYNYLQLQNKIPGINFPRSGRIITLRKGQQSAIQQLGCGRAYTHVHGFQRFPAANRSIIQLFTATKLPGINSPRLGRIIALQNGQQNAIQRLGNGGRNE